MTDLWMDTTATYRDAKHLQRLTELERRTPDSATEIDLSSVIGVLRDFLTEARPGGGYVSGLYLAGRLIVRFGVTSSNLPELDVERQPQQQVLTWLLQQGATGLSADEFAYCLDRSEWRSLVVATVANIDSANACGLTDDQLEDLASGQVPTDRVVPLSQCLRGGGLSSASNKLVENHFEASVDFHEPPTVLREADETGVLERFPERITASLSRWRPDDDVDDLQTLAELGCKHGQYDAVVLAVNRWLRARDWETVPDEQRTLVARAIEARIERAGAGDADGERVRAAGTRRERLAAIDHVETTIEDQADEWLAAMPEAEQWHVENTLDDMQESLEDGRRFNEATGRSRF